MSMIELPSVSVGEWTGIRRNTPMGLFAYRQAQALDLIEFPDYDSGDLTTEQRRETLLSSLYMKKPLGALGIFLSFVSLEDFIKDLFARMVENVLLVELYPKLQSLRAKKKGRTPDKMYLRLDTDPIGSIDPSEINEIIESVFQIKPILETEYSKLRDLALIRHTVAHHAAVIREVDVPRFQYFKVTANQQINPPKEFIKKSILYIYNVGRKIEIEIRQSVFSKFIPKLNSDWWISIPEELIGLIEFFDYFGFLETANGPVGYAEAGTQEYCRMQRDAEIIKTKLIQRCIEALKGQKT